jgi:hypothetical protein
MCARVYITQNAMLEEEAGMVCLSIYARASSSVEQE